MSSLALLIIQTVRARSQLFVSLSVLSLPCIHSAHAYPGLTNKLVAATAIIFSFSFPVMVSIFCTASYFDFINNLQFTR